MSAMSVRKKLKEFFKNSSILAKKLNKPVVGCYTSPPKKWSIKKPDLTNLSITERGLDSNAGGGTGSNRGQVWSLLGPNCLKKLVYIGNKRPLDSYACPDQNRGKRTKVIINKCKKILMQFSGKQQNAKHIEQYLFSLKSSGKALFQKGKLLLKNPS